MTQDDIERLGILEQNLSSLVANRQHLQKQILELEEAVKELETVEDAYQIVGTVMLKKSSKDLQKELSEKKETTTVKLESIQQQEKVLRDQLKKVQDSVMAELKKSQGD
ncbi:MAG: prefoldin subunit [Nanoarchaeota archaeon]|nr:prefoldin subunit [Nanoarchaeota archaeon]